MRLRFSERARLHYVAHRVYTLERRAIVLRATNGASGAGGLLSTSTSRTGEHRHWGRTPIVSTQAGTRVLKTPAIPMSECRGHQ
jgi:hypothetical protein